MRNLVYGAFAASAFAFGPLAAANEPVASNPAEDADCLISLVLLMEAADENDKDAIFSIAMYYFGRLGGIGHADKDYIISRMGRFVDGGTLFLAKSQTCANDFEIEGRKFDELANAIE